MFIFDLEFAIILQIPLISLKSFWISISIFIRKLWGKKPQNNLCSRQSIVPLYYLKFILIYYRCGISNYKDTTHRNFILCLMFSSNFGIWSHFSLINKNVTRWRHNWTILLHPIYASLQHKFSDLCFKKHKISKGSSVFHERMETVLIWWRFRRITSYLLYEINNVCIFLHKIEGINDLR